MRWSPFRTVNRSRVAAAGPGPSILRQVGMTSFIRLLEPTGSTHFTRMVYLRVVPSCVVLFYPASSRWSRPIFGVAQCSAPGRSVLGSISKQPCDKNTYSRGDGCGGKRSDAIPKFLVMHQIREARN